MHMIWYVLDRWSKIVVHLLIKSMSVGPWRIRPKGVYKYPMGFEARVDPSLSTRKTAWTRYSRWCCAKCELLIASGIKKKNVCNDEISAQTWSRWTWTSSRHTFRPWKSPQGRGQGPWNWGASIKNSSNSIHAFTFFFSLGLDCL